MIKKNIKGFISIICVFALLLSVVNVSKAASSEKATFDAVNRVLNAKVNTASMIPLYDNSNNVVAKFYKLKPVGYVILDAQTDGIVEASVVQNNKYIINGNKIYYYSGPLSYYESNSKIIWKYYIRWI